MRPAFEVFVSYVISDVKNKIRQKNKCYILRSWRDSGASDIWQLSRHFFSSFPEEIRERRSTTPRQSFRSFVAKKKNSRVNSRQLCSYKCNKMVITVEPPLTATFLQRSPRTSSQRHCFFFPADGLYIHSYFNLHNAT